MAHILPPRILLIALLSTLAATAQCAVDGYKVTTDRTVDSSSLETIVNDVFRLSGAKTNDEKAIAIYSYLHQVLFHRAYANEKAPQNVGPLKVINVYGWGLCGGEHTVLKALFETAGWQVRYRGWNGHTTVETSYDDKWHYFDVFLKCYYWTKDKSHIAGQDDINADPSIVLDGAKEGRVPPNSYLACGDSAAGVVSGCKGSHALAVSAHEQGWASVTGRDQNYSPLLTLRSGGALKLEWRNVPGMMVADGGTDGCHTCPNMKDTRGDPVLGPVLEHYGTRNFSNGTFTYAPDFSKEGDIADIELKDAKAAGGKLTASGTGSAIFKLNLAYPYASARVDATFEGGDGKISVSHDGGKTWAPSAVGDISPEVRQHYDVWVKAEFPGALTHFAVSAVVEHNRGALPYLYNGKNVITVATAANKLPEHSTLTVTYAYQEATAPKRSQFNGQGITYSDTKTVTKEVTELPFTFTLDVGGTEPPKMISLERALKPK